MSSPFPLLTRPTNNPRHPQQVYRISRRVRRGISASGLGGPIYTEAISVRNSKKIRHAKGEEGEEGVVPGSSGSPSESQVDTGTNDVIEDEDESDDIMDVFKSLYEFRFEEPYAFPRTLYTVVDR